MGPPRAQRWRNGGKHDIIFTRVIVDEKVRHDEKILNCTLPGFFDRFSVCHLGTGIAGTTGQEVHHAHLNADDTHFDITIRWTYR
jgi:hypothetical protein